MKLDKQIALLGHYRLLLHTRIEEGANNPRINRSFSAMQLGELNEWIHELEQVAQEVKDAIRGSI